LETESLLLAKQILYVDGIGGQINSESGKSSMMFSGLGVQTYVLVEARKAFLIGRIWSSRDGKNRTKYSAGRVRSLPESSVHLGIDSNVSQCLGEIEWQCKSTRFAGEVRGFLDRRLTG
jgi:hypothetical protein